MDNTSHSRPSKVRGALLPSEYELTRFVSKIENPHISWSASTPACEWKGVTCVDSRIQIVDWGRSGLKGSLLFEWMPRASRFFYLFNNQVGDFVKLDSLPPQLTCLDLDINTFSGSIDLIHIPSTFRTLSLRNNAFAGSVDLNHLPPNLEELYLNNNNLSGRVDLDRLPLCMISLDLSHNRFTGFLSLEKLPPLLEYAFFDCNCFYGLVQFETLPVTLESLSIKSNLELVGEIKRHSLPDKLTSIDIEDTQISLIP